MNTLLIVYMITVMAVWVVVGLWVADNDPPHWVTGFSPDHDWWQIPLIWTLVVATIGCFWPLFLAWVVIDHIVDNLGEDDE